MKPTPKPSICVIQYNDNFDSDLKNDVEFANVNLLCNELSLRLLANDSITCTKKNCVVKIENKVKETSKVKAT